jgi:hypothetical protein
LRRTLVLKVINSPKMLCNFCSPFYLYYCHGFKAVAIIKAWYDLSQ